MHYVQLSMDNVHLKITIDNRQRTFDIGQRTFDNRRLTFDNGHLKVKKMTFDKGQFEITIDNGQLMGEIDN